MGESAWVDMGAALKTLFWEQMGRHSHYPNLRLQQALVTMLWDVSDYAKWSSDNLMPTLLIEGRWVRPRAREHGAQDAPPLFSDPARHIENEYLYSIVAITRGEREQAEVDAKILIKRVMNVILTEKTLAVTDTSGERVTNIMPSSPVGAAILRTSGSDLLWYGVGVVGLSIITKT